MVQLKETPHFRPDGSVDIDAWITHISAQRSPSDIRLIRNACALSQLAGAKEIQTESVSYLEQGIAMAEILADLNSDAESIATAVVYESVQYGDLTSDDVAEHLGKTVAKLVAGVARMSAIDSVIDNKGMNDSNRIDNLRKMLLGMVDDVRVVFIKLAERTFRLRQARLVDETKKKKIAKEVQDIYAPLANRLGIGQLKWELEDLAFRYLEPDTYKEIAKLVDERRIDRERYVVLMLAELKLLVEQAGVNDTEIQGRAKHIYSIYKKMRRKKVGFDQIYDATAVRVLARSIEDCYAVLSAVHGRWQHIPAEFDDYVSNPKPNGYRSIHTAVIGPNNKNVEVQIRTFDMHQESEMGFAAHWKYKEGASQKTAYEDKIALLRQVLAWQNELSASGKPLEEIPADVFKDRVYVFTPGGDIVDLAQGATPLDFAYHIHSEVGHRCRGAKVNDHIVPLTYTLKTGDRVEVLTAKHPKPSRDWLNPEHGYLTTSRARAKVHHWFKQEDYEQHREDGQEIITRELRHLNLAMPNFDKLALKFNFKSGNDLLAALGNGDIRPAQIINLVQIEQAKEKPIILPTLPAHIAAGSSKAPSTDITIQGVDNLLTSMAKCCKPIPGDAIIGYITAGRGVTIHRSDCGNVKEMQHSAKERLIDVSWGTELDTAYPVDIYIYAQERVGLVREVTLILTNDHIDITSMHTLPDKNEGNLMISLTVSINHLSELGKVMNKIKQVQGVTHVKRQRFN